jgi:ABC-type transport system involved in multi-copper enzyme maturation permease subunit
MTAAVANQAPRANQAPLDFSQAGTRLSRVIRSEWTKIWSVRSTFWTLLSLVVLTVGLSTLFAWGASSHLNQMNPQDRANLDVTNASMGGLAFGQLAIAVLGVMVISSEYSTGGIKATLTAVPQRMKVLAAKSVVFAFIALVVGLITAFAAFFVSMLFWTHYGLEAHLGDPGVLRAVIGGGLYVAASGMFGLALGTLLRHTAGAITLAVGLLLVAPSLTNLLPGTWGKDINKYFTANAGQRITEVHHTVGQLTPWAGYLTLTVEWLVPLLIGAYLMRRRDA